MNGIPDYIKGSSLFREFQAEREEILKLKWKLSEEAGHDVGFEHALTDWIVKHRRAWRKSRQKQLSEPTISHETLRSTPLPPRKQIIRGISPPRYLDHQSLFIDVYQDADAFRHKNALPLKAYREKPNIFALTGSYEIQPSGILQRIPLMRHKMLEGGIFMSEYRQGTSWYKVHVRGGLELALGLNEKSNLIITAIKGDLPRER